MFANKNWPRWIFASIADHFKAAADENEIPLLIEGIEDRTSEKIRKISHAELRVNGPVVRELSKNYFYLTVNVNVILQSMMTEENGYDIIQDCGVFLEAMGPFDVFKHGNGPEDDGTFLGCLDLRTDVNEAVFVAHFGQLNQETRIRESMVGGKYQIFLQN